MRKAVLSVLVVSVIAVFAGCAGVQIKKADIDEIKSAGILSLTVKKAGPDNPGNDAVIQQTANFSLYALEKKLSSTMPFKIVPVSTLAKNPEFRNSGTIAKAAGASKYLKNNPKSIFKGNSSEKETSGDFMAALKEGLQAAAKAVDAMADPAAYAQGIMDEGKKTAVGAGMAPFIPYGVLNNETGTVRYVNGVKQAGKNEGLKEMMLEQVKEVCAKTKLDAVMVVYGEVVAEPPKGVRVITGDRVVGTLKYDMTLMLINKKGEILADFNWPVMDDLAPLKLARPTYKGITFRTVKGKKWPDKIEVDLNDPKGELLRDLKELAGISADHLAGKLGNAIAEAK